MKLRTADSWPKKKRFNKIIGIVDASLIKSSAIAGGTFIPAFASGVGLPVGAALRKNSEKSYLNKEEKKAKKIFLRQIANSSGTQGVNAI